MTLGAESLGIGPQEVGAAGMRRMASGAFPFRYGSVQDFEARSDSDFEMTLTTDLMLIGDQEAAPAGSMWTMTVHAVASGGFVQDALPFLDGVGVTLGADLTPIGNQQVLVGSTMPPMA